MSIYIYSLLSVVFVSLLSFIGVSTFVFSQEKLKKITIFLVGFSTGALLGDAFLHLIPEMKNSSLGVWLWLLGGIITFFILEKILFWHHCHIHSSGESHHSFGLMNLFGGGLHNFIDGMIIAGSFMVNIGLGLATTIAVVSHEIPHEMSDFGILVHAGYERKKALFLNFVSALAAILGAFAAFIIGGSSGNFISYIIPFTAGGFIYVAIADLMPELQKNTYPLKSVLQLISILVGIGLMLWLKIIGTD